MANLEGRNLARAALVSRIGDVRDSSVDSPDRRDSRTFLALAQKLEFHVTMWTGDRQVCGTPTRLLPRRGCLFDKVFKVPGSRLCFGVLARHDYSVAGVTPDK
jgi:hypothetical protein